MCQAHVNHMQHACIREVHRLCLYTYDNYCIMRIRLLFLYSLSFSVMLTEFRLKDTHQQLNRWLATPPNHFTIPVTENFPIFVVSI